MSNIKSVTINYVDGTSETIAGDVTPTPPSPPIPPTPIVTAYSKTIRYGLANNAYKADQNNFTAKQTVINLPPQKGLAALQYKGSNPAPLSLPIFDQGMIWMQNQEATGFTAQIGASPIARELWIILTKTTYAQWEAIFGAYDLPYLAELNGNNNGLRVQNSGNSYAFPNVVINPNQPIVIRLKITTTALNPMMQVFVNGVSIGTAATQPIKSNTIGFGTDSANCAYFGFSELLDFPILSDAQAASILTELTAEYGIGKTTAMPYATLKLSKTASSTTVSYTYNGTLPEDTSKRIIKWVTWPKGNPDVQNYMPQYAGMETIQMALVGRVEVTVFDTAGNYFALPQSAFLQ